MLVRNCIYLDFFSQKIYHRPIESIQFFRSVKLEISEPKIGLKQYWGLPKREFVMWYKPFWHNRYIPPLMSDPQWKTV